MLLRNHISTRPQQTLVYSMIIHTDSPAILLPLRACDGGRYVEDNISLFTQGCFYTHKWIFENKARQRHEEKKYIKRKDLLLVRYQDLSWYWFIFFWRCTRPIIVFNSKSRSSDSDHLDTSQLLESNYMNNCDSKTWVCVVMSQQRNDPSSPLCFI